MGRAMATSSSSSSYSTDLFAFSSTASFSSSSQRDLSTNLHLGLRISISPPYAIEPMKVVVEEEYECNNSTFFAKVYIEGIPIGRKLDLMAHESYYDLIRALENIIWAEAEVDGDKCEKCHVLTYEDNEGVWMVVDVLVSCEKIEDQQVLKQNTKSLVLKVDILLCSCRVQIKGIVPWIFSLSKFKALG
ncbi:Flavin containing amine oxidoreductase family [Hibiscus syriacus]|uniref:Auxin-responsive protein n=1 Tax=Hibiscus syriacus TaxID=106335 RepID=A0A6A2Y135_HIBSY|nr:Flavin containing amine oxidoreductase family [Hibiscus syriacus]